jgi:predicted outer membrane repeat protein
MKPLWRAVAYSLLVFALVSGWLAEPEPVEAGAKHTFNVNTTSITGDNNHGDCICDDGSGNCSVNGAVAEAASCAGDDTILIPVGTYIVQPTLSIHSNVTIQGAGSSLTILKVNVQDEIFSVGQSGNLELRDLKIQDTGGIYNVGGLTIFNSVFVDNHGTGEKGGGAIDNRANLLVMNSTFSGNDALSTTSRYGGAIYGEGAFAQGSTNIIGCVFLSNTAGKGGALAVNGSFMTLNITSSEFGGNNASIGGALYVGSSDDNVISYSSIHDNSAEEYGGGIFVGDAVSGDTFTTTAELTITNSSITNNGALLSGGGMYIGDFPDQLLSHHVNLVNTTFSGNSSHLHGGGIHASERSYVNAHNVSIIDNTADINGNDAGNGGGIYILNDPSITFTNRFRLENTVVAANHDLSGGTLPVVMYDCQGNFITSGRNLIGILQAGVCNLTVDSGGNFSGTMSLPLDPKVDALTSGSYATSYHLPQAHSPLVDAGDAAGCKDHLDVLLTEDQRGESRHMYYACDIGAAESLQQGVRVFLPFLKN